MLRKKLAEDLWNIIQPMPHCKRAALRLAFPSLRRPRVFGVLVWHDGALTVRPVGRQYLDRWGNLWSIVNGRTAQR